MTNIDRGFIIFLVFALLALTGLNRITITQLVNEMEQLHVHKPEGIDDEI